MLAVKGEPVVVWLAASTPRDAGTGRCRLPRALLKQLQLRPGDGVVIEVRGSDRLFLCSASLRSRESGGAGWEDDGCASGHGQDCGAGGGQPSAAVQVDGCVELPLDLLPPGVRTEWTSSSATEWNAAQPPADMVGLGAVHALKRSAVAASSLRLCCSGFGGDPEAAVRVALANALNRHVLCRDAQLVIPDLGTLTVEETLPSSSPVTVLCRTRISFSSCRETGRRGSEAPGRESASGKKDEGGGGQGGGVLNTSVASGQETGPGGGRDVSSNVGIPGGSTAGHITPLKSDAPAAQPVWMPPTRRSKGAISFTASPSPSPSPLSSAAAASSHSPGSEPAGDTTPAHNQPPSNAPNLCHTPSHDMPEGERSPYFHSARSLPYSPSPSPCPSPSNNVSANPSSRASTSPSPKSETQPRRSSRQNMRHVTHNLPFSVLSSVAAARGRPKVQMAQGLDKAETVFCGSGAALETLRDAMWVVLREQGKMTRVGIGASKGMLLVGPPGSGKSFLVRALAAEFDVVVMTIHPDDVYQGGAGEGEERLRQVFRAASKAAPCIILLKHIDVTCPARQLGRDAQARVVAQLLSLMDGGRQGSGSVMVVGTCCKPNLIDVAMRRPGRLDREVSLTAPSAMERKEMLELFVAQMSRRQRQRPVLAADVSLDLVARKAVGFVGAGLKALCSHAAGASILREGSCVQHASRSLGGEGRPDNGRAEVLIRNDDFEKALEQVRYRGGTAFEVAPPQAGGLDEEVGGLEQVKQVLRQAIEWPLLYPHKLKAMGVRPSRGVLLYGAPGCGKTSLVRAAANVSGVGFLKANGAEMFSAFLGESERIVRDLFARARTLEPCILFLDEIDAIVGRRSLEGGSDGAEAGGVRQRVLSTILNELDGVDSAGGVILVGATNRLDMIDPALLRPGRFDHLVHVPLPDAKGRHDILLKCSRNMKMSADVDLHHIALATEGFTGAELTRVCKEAALAALREDITLTSVSASHFEKALENVTPARVVVQ